MQRLAVIHEEEVEQEVMLVRQHTHQKAAASAHNWQMCGELAFRGAAGGEEMRTRSSAAAARLMKLALAESTKEHLAKLASAQSTLEHGRARLAKLGLTERTRARLAKLALTEHDLLQRGEFGFA